MDKYWTKHFKSTESTLTKGVYTNRLSVTPVMDTCQKSKEEKYSTENNTRCMKKQKSEIQKQKEIQYQRNKKKTRKARKRMIHDIIKEEMNRIAYKIDDTVASEDEANALITDDTTDSDDNFGILSIYSESSIHFAYDRDSIGQSSDDDFGYVYFSICDFLK